MKKHLLPLLIMLISLSTTFGQTDYANGNQAYENEKTLGHNPVTINGGSMIYTWDCQHQFYICERYVLIPNLDTTSDGKWVDNKILFGLGIGGLINDTSYNYDNQTILSGNSVADASPLFVSPVSSTGMSFAKALQNNGSYCGWANCYAQINGPLSTLAYPGYQPDTGYFNIWAGEELINMGPIKGTSLDQKISQQQLGTGSNQSYCVATYGQGWRLPTDMEAGHTNDSEGTGNGFQDVYQSSTNGYMWTSTLFKSYTVKRWAVGFNSGYWENCSGFVYVNNRVRCVYDPAPQVVTEIVENKPSKTCIYPNPVDETLVLACLDPNIIKARLTDVSGKTIALYELSENMGRTELTISQLETGIYFLLLESSTGNQQSKFKFIKK